MLIIRLAAWAAFYGLAVVLPGFLLGRALVGERGRTTVLVGVLGVFAMAVLLAFLMHARISRPILAISGALVAIASSGILRRREKLKDARRS